MPKPVYRNALKALAKPSSLLAAGIAGSTQGTKEPNGYKLAQEIINLSEADYWHHAKLEWGLAEIFFTEQPGTCICGHSIIEHCLLINSLNGNEAVVGNICVKRFVGLNSDKLFASIKRVAADTSRAFNIEMIEHAFEKQWINNWEYEFYCDTLRKRKLSDKQRAKRVQINEKVLDALRTAVVV